MKNLGDGMMEGGVDELSFKRQDNWARRSHSMDRRGKGRAIIWKPRVSTEKKWIAPSIENRCVIRRQKGTRNPSTVQYHRLGISVTAVQTQDADWHQQTNIVESWQDGKRVWVQVGFLEGDEFILVFFFCSIILAFYGLFYYFFGCSASSKPLCNLATIKWEGGRIGTIRLGERRAVWPLRRKWYVQIHGRETEIRRA